MYPTSVEQNRQDGIHPQTVHLHMHQLCTCVHPYYSGYRPPPLLASPFPVQPIPRPYNLQHYQYTQFNVSPYNFPLGHSQPIAQPQSITSPHHSTSTTLDFGPPSRDRRSYECNESSLPEATNTSEVKENREFFEDFLSMGAMTDTLPNVGLQDALAVSTENFTKFLEQGCVLAEKIAIRNQHRPCFKNIQNLCNRTRGEILKPSNTVSNIHSQGIPWATKDFIYAFVRLINCWHMLKGYLDSKDGTLGNIDKELTPEFKACYLAWEKDTKELSAHMVRIFSNLDNNVTNPNPANSYILRNKPSVTVVTPKNPIIPPPQSLVQEKESNASVKAVRGILHIPAAPLEVMEAVIFSESPGTSPREEESDNESRVYMKPGSYNVPKKPNSSNNSTPSIEFFETAQNVSAHYKKMAKKKSEMATSDKIWQDAQSAVPYLLNKINPQTQQEELVTCEDPDDALKYFIDLNTLDQGSDIQEWLNNNNFVENTPNDPSEGLQSPSTQDFFTSTKQVTLLQRAQKTSKAVGEFSGEMLVNSLKNLQLSRPTSSIGNLVESRTFRKRCENESKISLKSFSGVKKTENCNSWESDNGGLAANTVMILEKILKSLENHELISRLPKVQILIISFNFRFLNFTVAVLLNNFVFL